MRRDVNRFVDEVYVPFQIRFVMNRQKDLALSTNPEDQRKSILTAIDGAFKPEAPSEKQEVALKAMEIFVRKIRGDVEALRNQLIDTLDIQEGEVLGSIDRAYQQLHYANSIVTGHLSSVVKVHDAQADMLQALGVDRDLRRVVGESLANASEKIADVVDKAETASDKLADVEENAASLKKAIAELKQKLNTKGKDK
jgi:ABC-type transporter Mla subunit MlaD